MGGRQSEEEYPAWAVITWRAAQGAATEHATIRFAFSVLSSATETYPSMSGENGTPPAGPGGPTAPQRHKRLRTTGFVGQHAAGRGTQLALRAVSGAGAAGLRLPPKVPMAAGSDWANLKGAVGGPKEELDIRADTWTST